MVVASRSAVAVTLVRAHLTWMGVVDDPLALDMLPPRMRTVATTLRLPGLRRLAQHASVPGGPHPGVRRPPRPGARRRDRSGCHRRGGLRQPRLAHGASRRDVLRGGPTGHRGSGETTYFRLPAERTPDVLRRAGWTPDPLLTADDLRRHLEGSPLATMGEGGAFIATASR